MKFGTMILAFALLLPAAHDAFGEDQAKERRVPAVLHWCFPQDISGFDPVLAKDSYTSVALSQIYECLMQYNYLERPYRLEPCLAEAMPDVSDDGLVYTFRIRKGVRYPNAKCFLMGGGRALTAEDFVYSLKRIADFKNDSPSWWLLDGRILGLNEFREKSRADRPRTNYGRPVEGLKALGDHVLRITLTRPFPALCHVLAMPCTGVVPWEAVVGYGADFNRRPVGTGPYRLERWEPGARIVFERNPVFRDGAEPARDGNRSDPRRTFPLEGAPGDRDAGLLNDAGKTLPFCDRIIVHVVPDDSARWNKFLGGEADQFSILKSALQMEINFSERELPPSLREMGVSLRAEPSLDVTYTAFNMEDPILGRNKHLRQAMSLAFDAAGQISGLRHGRAIPAFGPIPPGLSGHEGEGTHPFRMTDMNAALERSAELLEKAGYPGGKGLPVFTLQAMASPKSRPYADHFVNCMKKIGVRFEIEENTWEEFLGKIKGKKAQVFAMAWLADYCDPENFLQLFYGKNASPGSNTANYANPEYDSLFEKIASMRDCPERRRIVRRMVTVLCEDCPWIFGVHRLQFFLHQKWLRNYKPHSIGTGLFKYYRVDTTIREKSKSE